MRITIRIKISKY